MGRPAEQFITRQRVLQSETAIYVRESLSPCLQGRSSSARWVHLLLSEAGFRLRRCKRNQSFKDPARINACASAKARCCCCCCCSPLLLLLSLTPRIIRRVFESCRVTQHALHFFFFPFFFFFFLFLSLVVASREERTTRPSGFYGFLTDHISRRPTTTHSLLLRLLSNKLANLHACVCASLLNI